MTDKYMIFKVDMLDKEAKKALTEKRRLRGRLEKIQTRLDSKVTEYEAYAIARELIKEARNCPEQNASYYLDLHRNQETAAQLLCSWFHSHGLKAEIKTEYKQPGDWGPNIRKQWIELEALQNQPIKRTSILVSKEEFRAMMQAEMRMVTRGRKTQSENSLVQN